MLMLLGVLLCMKSMLTDTSAGPTCAYAMRTNMQADKVSILHAIDCGACFCLKTVCGHSTGNHNSQDLFFHSFVSSCKLDTSALLFSGSWYSAIG